MFLLCSRLTSFVRHVSILQAARTDPHSGSSPADLTGPLWLCWKVYPIWTFFFLLFLFSFWIFCCGLWKEGLRSVAQDGSNARNLIFYYMIFLISMYSSDHCLCIGATCFFSNTWLTFVHTFFDVYAKFPFYPDRCIVESWARVPITSLSLCLDITLKIICIAPYFALRAHYSTFQSGTWSVNVESSWI